MGAGVLTEGAAGRFDSAVADLSDGRRVVVRAPVDAEGDAELAAEARALRALTPGVRGLLPFRAPELLGEASLGDVRTIVVDYLPGYRVDAAHLPAGRGAAWSVGEALAALHALPPSIVRADGLPVRSAQQVRDDALRIVERAEGTRRLPPALATRWRRALGSDRLWRFESAVILGAAGAGSFLFDDLDDAPRVSGVLGWHGLSVGDPATDLQWLASAPSAADDVHDAYAAVGSRAPDALLRERARLYAELEFAKWLLHGHDSGQPDVVDDAVALLEALAEGVEGNDLVLDEFLGVDDAIALLDRVPVAPALDVDTSMQTDAYDPEKLAEWIADATEAAARDTFDPDDTSTAPVELPADTHATTDAAVTGSTGAAEFGTPDTEPDATADADEASRAADAALRRWTGTDR